MSRMLSQAEGTTRDIPSTPVSRTDGMSRAVFTDRANTTLQAVEEGSKDWDGELTEEMMLSLIADDSFMAEVGPSSNLFLCSTFLIAFRFSAALIVGYSSFGAME